MLPANPKRNYKGNYNGYPGNTLVPTPCSEYFTSKRRRIAYQFKTVIPQNETSNDIRAMTTIPTLLHAISSLGDFHKKKIGGAYVQLRSLLDTLANACPPTMLFRIENPIIVMRFNAQGTITP